MTYNQYFSLKDLYRDLGQPLPEDIKTYEKNLANIGALDLSNENIRQKFPEQFWQTAVLYSINLFPQDLEYLKDVIKTDRIFNLVNFEFIPGLDENQNSEISIKKLLCYERFYNDKNCPKQLKKVLYVLIGTSKDCISKDVQLSRSKLMELWFDRVR